MKIVITGGPCSGKSTIIHKLKRRGYFAMEECARTIITEKGYSKNLDRYKDEILDLQLEIYDMQIDREKDLDKADDVYPHPVFLDRGYIDTLVYCEHLLGYIPERIRTTDVKPYDAIIVLERLPFEEDDVRRENDFEAAKLHEAIITAYKDKGYDPIIIPATSIEDRIKIILKIMDKLIIEPKEGSKWGDSIMITAANAAEATATRNLGRLH